jgi:hypothetical protein
VDVSRHAKLEVSELVEILPEEASRHHAQLAAPMRWQESHRESQASVEIAASQKPRRKSMHQLLETAASSVEVRLELVPVQAESPESG